MLRIGESLLQSLHCMEKAVCVLEKIFGEYDILDRATVDLKYISTLLRSASRADNS